jgi:CRISPR-associated protein Cas2
MARLWLITYDISDPKRLRRVAQTLETCATRVQESVFEMWARRHDITLLEAKLSRLIDAEEDNIRLYPLCGQCVGLLRWQGEGEHPGGAMYWLV